MDIAPPLPLVDRSRLKTACLLLAAFWVGSLCTIGYVVAPTLFATLADRALAGTIAGNLFRVEAWISLVCALLLAAVLLKLPAVSMTPAARRRLLQITAGMALCTLIGYFGLQPFMASVRAAAAAAGGMSGDARMQFGILHGAASGIYLIQSLLGVWLLVRLA